MTTKERIIKKIEEVDDPQLLEDLEKFILAFADAEESFSKDEIAAVYEGYAQYKSGNVLSHQEAEEIFNKWLKGK